MKKIFLKGCHDGIPIALGYLSVSFTFGLMAVSVGMTPLQAVLISMTNLTSAGQFAGLELMASGGMLLEMALVQFIINLRYSLMSISLSQKTDRSFTIPVRLLAAIGITDEVFAVSYANNREINKWYMAGIIIVPYFGWAGGTLIGALVGTSLPEIVINSLGIAIYGMFLAIIIPPARKNSGILKVVIIAVVIRVILFYTPVLNKISSGFAIIICAVVASGIGAFFFPVRDEEQDSGEDAGAEKEGR